MSQCSNALRANGKAYPRTCQKCGLGPCQLRKASPPEIAGTEIAKPYVKRNQPGGPRDGGEVVIPFVSDAEMEAILRIYGLGLGGAA